LEELIRFKLKEIEEKENVKILHSVESGSRAWGFASSDSDYDVRFVYVRPKEFYLRLDKTRDVIEWQLDATLDINGWDISKALILLHSSNPTVFEWNMSPIVYKTTDQWSQLSKVLEEYFDPKSSLYHYLSMAKKNQKEYLKSDTVSFKKYFYMLRPLLACRWILAEGTPPPVPFGELVKSRLEPRLLSEVNTLLDLKQNGSERLEGKRFAALDEYIERSIDEIESLLKLMPPNRKSSWDDLNQAFGMLLW
jgi:predicted nucleotidyltransferase